jgi:ribosome-binding protein aMBF1 (putative translation factor)
MTKKKTPTTNALEILQRRFYDGRPGRQASLAKERLNAAIAQDIYDLRIKAGLTQQQLAKLVGTTGSVISRLESADYSGHSLSMLQRISHAMNCRLDVHFVPQRAARKIPA